MALLSYPGISWERSSSGCSAFVINNMNYTSQLTLWGVHSIQPRVLTLPDEYHRYHLLPVSHSFQTLVKYHNTFPALNISGGRPFQKASYKHSTPCCSGTWSERTLPLVRKCGHFHPMKESVNWKANHDQLALDSHRVTCKSAQLVSWKRPRYTQVQILTSQWLEILTHPKPKARTRWLQREDMGTCFLPWSRARQCFLTVKIL